MFVTIERVMFVTRCEYDVMREMRILFVTK